MSKWSCQILVHASKCCRVLSQKILQMVFTSGKQKKSANFGQSLRQSAAHSRRAKRQRICSCIAGKSCCKAASDYYMYFLNIHDNAVIRLLTLEYFFTLCARTYVPRHIPYAFCNYFWGWRKPYAKCRITQASRILSYYSKHLRSTTSSSYWPPAS